MPKPVPAWLKGTGLGCLGLLVLLVLAAIVGTVFVNVSGQRDIATLAQLDREHPDAGAYTPPVDGRIPPDRLAKFLAVRRALAVHCAELGDATERFRRMEQYGEADEDSLRMREFFRDTGRALGGMFRLAGRIGRYLEQRNRALLAEGMGLGEYTWIQVTAYQGWLREPHRRFALAREDEPRIFQDRVVPQLREMIRRHLEARERTGASPSELAPWRQELAALTADPERAPFADGVPPEIAASLEPFREELREVWCPATCELDLTVTIREGIGFEHI